MSGKYNKYKKRQNQAVSQDNIPIKNNEDTNENIKKEERPSPHYYIEPLRIVSDKVIEMGNGRISKKYIDKVIEYENQYATRRTMYLRDYWFEPLVQHEYDMTPPKIFAEKLYEDCACFVRDQLEKELKLSRNELFYNILDYIAKSHDLPMMGEITGIYKLDLEKQRLRIKYNDFSRDTKVDDLKKREAGEKRPIVGMSDDWIRHFERCPSSWCLMWRNFQKNWTWVLPCLLLCTVANKGLQSAIGLLLFMGIGTWYEYHVEIFLGCCVMFCLNAGIDSWFEETQYEKEQKKQKKAIEEEKARHQKNEKG